VAGAALLHDDRHDPRIVGALLEQTADRVREHLGGDIVDVRLDKCRVDQCAVRTTVDEYRRHDVGMSRRISPAGAAGCRSHATIGDLTPLCCQRRQKGGARRGARLTFVVEMAHGAAVQQRQRRRGRERQHPVGSLDGSVAKPDRCNDDAADRTVRSNDGVEEQPNTDDVDDRVDGADFVKVHVVDVDTMLSCLDIAEAAEAAAGAIGDLVGQVDLSQETIDRTPRAAMFE